MDLEEVLKLISESADRLAAAAKISTRDEKWWSYLANEDWNLIKLSWALRGVILRRGEGTEVGLDLDHKAKKQLEEILEVTELKEESDSD